MSNLETFFTLDYPKVTLSASRAGLFSNRCPALSIVM